MNKRVLIRVALPQSEHEDMTMMENFEIV